MVFWVGRFKKSLLNFRGVLVQCGEVDHQLATEFFKHFGLNVFYKVKIATYWSLGPESWPCPRSWRTCACEYCWTNLPPKVASSWFAKRAVPFPFWRGTGSQCALKTTAGGPWSGSLWWSSCLRGCGSRAPLDPCSWSELAPVLLRPRKSREASEATLESRSASSYHHL